MRYPVARLGWFRAPVLTTAPLFQRQRFAAAEIVEDFVGGHDFHGNWKDRRHQHIAQDVFQTMFGDKVPGPQSNGIVGTIDWREKWQSDDMIEMGVAKQNIGVDGPVFHQRVAEGADTGSRVENYRAAATMHLDARRIAAVTVRLGPRSGNRPTYPPKPGAHQSSSPNGISIPSKAASSFRSEPRNFCRYSDKIASCSSSLRAGAW